ncbi:MAG: hypothetical protein IPL55_10065 [Saprospiraceae bacterium]|nr:hypothetical protein [Saprospiraceae bacterium]
MRKAKLCDSHLRSPYGLPPWAITKLSAPAKVQAVINNNNEIIKQIITLVKPFFTLVNFNRIRWSISPDYT